MQFEWSGRFTSLQYGSFIWPFVSGKIRARLPATLEEVRDKQVTLFYDGWYRDQQIAHLSMSYFSEKNGQGGGNQMGFTASGLTTVQKIRFAIVSIKRNDCGDVIEMTGLYESEKPGDKGNWSLMRT